MKFVSKILIMTLLLSIPVFANSFVENWNRDAIASNWFQVPVGKWGICDQKYLWGESVGNATWSRQVCYIKSADDYSLSAKLKFFGEQGKVFRPRAGIASSIKDNLDFTSLIVWIDFASRRITVLVKSQGKNILWKESAPLSTKIDLFKWHKLSIEKKSDNVKISFDDKKMLEVTAKINGGRFACLIEDAHADFSTITLKNLSDKFTRQSVFTKCGSRKPGKEGLVLPYIPKVSWRSVHAANAAFLKNIDPRDRKEKIYFYFRGTDKNKGLEINSIGLWTQPAETFSPTDEWKTIDEGGKWTDHGIVINSGPEIYDCNSVLDTCVTKGPHGEIYVYYIGKDNHYDATLCVAKSKDGGFTFKKSKNNPIMKDVGPTDAVYHNGKFYVFYGDAKWDRSIRRSTDKLTIYVAVTKNPVNLKNAKIYKCVAPGKTGEWDSSAVGGGRIFRLNGKWWMVYQAGDSHFDFHPRMNAAYSDDLTHWEKVNSPFPLFLRGESGNWDQGAIWWGEILPWENKLYMFYEGWGSLGFTPVRNSDYYYPGRSQLGRSSCTTNQFLKWAFPVSCNP
ncbi:hypothetical protein KAH27_02940 [bacterium]|nr:hypothetical protein [bacterium]